GRISIENDHRSGRPSTSKTNDTITLVRNKFRYDRRLTVREVVNKVGISIGTCHSILSDELSMKRVSAKRVPKLLTMKTETIQNAAQELKAITMEDIQRCFKKWRNRWDHCIEAKGHYFEGKKDQGKKEHGKKE
ncbi:protein GVQW3-like, partial [Aphis craccivora]